MKTKESRFLCEETLIKFYNSKNINNNIKFKWLSNKEEVDNYINSRADEKTPTPTIVNHKGYKNIKTTSSEFKDAGISQSEISFFLNSVEAWYPFEITCIIVPVSETKIS
jgi:hypothetical protein